MAFEMLLFQQALGSNESQEIRCFRLPKEDEGGAELFMSDRTQHEYAVYLFQQDTTKMRSRTSTKSSARKKTGERWSDWATAQFALSRFPEAERGFRRALELNPDLPDAAVSFGAMLMSLSRWKEAIAMLEECCQN